MLSITINQQPYDIGKPLPSKVESLSMAIPPGIMVPSNQTPLVRSWLKTLKSKLVCKYISYNDVLVCVKDL